MASAIIRHGSQPVPSRRQVVERAEAFLSARAGESVSIAELCRVAGVSERSLRNAFYDVRGMSPKRCAVRARLGSKVRRVVDTEARASRTRSRARVLRARRFASTTKRCSASPRRTLRDGRVQPWRQPSSPPATLRAARRHATCLCRRLCAPGARERYSARRPSCRDCRRMVSSPPINRSRSHAREP
jgi:AraC-like DNA-binding protein